MDQVCASRLVHLNGISRARSRNRTTCKKYTLQPDAARGFETCIFRAFLWHTPSQNRPRRITPTPENAFGAFSGVVEDA
jgi:hypothetical protein